MLELQADMSEAESKMAWKLWKANNDARAAEVIACAHCSEDSADSLQTLPWVGVEASEGRRGGLQI